MNLWDVLLHHVVDVVAGNAAVASVFVIVAVVVFAPLGVVFAIGVGI